MPPADKSPHDWDTQYRETESVWHDLKSKGVDFSRKKCLDYQFVPDDKGADERGFSDALRMAGYRVSLYEDDETVEASVPSLIPSLENVWHHEKRTTEIALRFRYRPDGWGFMDPSG